MSIARSVICTKEAPSAIGPYSQAVKSNGLVFFSGQIPLHPDTLLLVSEDFRTQVDQVFQNISAVCIAAGGSLQHIVKLTVYLTDLTQFAIFNDVMQHYFSEPYPARTTVEVSALPKSAQVEIEAIMSMTPT